MRDFLDDGQVVVNVLRVEGNLVSVGVSFIDAVPRVLHREHMDLVN